MTPSQPSLHPPLASTVIAMADLGHAILYRPSMSSMGSLRLERIARLRNHWRHMPVQARPTMAASGRGASATVHLIDENRPGAAEEMDRRFARTLADWLHERAGADASARIVVFSPPHLLGLLREIAPAGLELRHADLTKATAGELARHPAVIEALFGPRAS